MTPLPKFLIGDHIRLKQILINLVKNALKFTLRGTVQLVATYNQAAEMLEVSVIDNGKGIRPEEMSSLFKQFGKLKRTARMNSDGIGMGLMICQKLVSLNKGEITVHSDGENKGSIFSFTMSMQQEKN